MISSLRLLAHRFLEHAVGPCVRFHRGVVCFLCHRSRFLCRLIGCARLIHGLRGVSAFGRAHSRQHLIHLGAICPRFLQSSVSRCARSFSFLQSILCSGQSL